MTQYPSDDLGEVALRRVIDQAKAFGFLGPGEVSIGIDHAMGFLRTAVASIIGSADHWLDLGSGGGLPGLVGVVRLPTSRWTLLDAQEKRVTFLRWACEQLPTSLCVDQRITVAHGRAESLARAVNATETFDIAVARGFAPPSVTAECASRFLRLGGVLVVSEPPDSIGDRWRALDQSGLGLTFESVFVDEGSGARFSVIRKIRPTPERFPRSGAALAKRPLF